MTAPVLLVDAANVVGTRPDGWWRDRAGAAGRLVAALRAAPPDRLASLPARRPGAAPVLRVVVVLEGAARLGAPEGPVRPLQGAAPSAVGVEVVHAPASGDDALAARCSGDVVLVTADRELRRRAEAAGAAVVGPRALLAALDPT